MIYIDTEGNYFYILIRYFSKVGTTFILLVSICKNFVQIDQSKQMFYLFGEVDPENSISQLVFGKDS